MKKKGVHVKVFFAPVTVSFLPLILETVKNWGYDGNTANYYS